MDNPIDTSRIYFRITGPENKLPITVAETYQIVPNSNNSNFSFIFNLENDSNIANIIQQLPNTWEADLCYTLDGKEYFSVNFVDRLSLNNEPLPKDGHSFDSGEHFLLSRGFLHSSLKDRETEVLTKNGLTLSQIALLAGDFYGTGEDCTPIWSSNQDELAKSFENAVKFLCNADKSEISAILEQVKNETNKVLEAKRANKPTQSVHNILTSN